MKHSEFIEALRSSRPDLFKGEMTDRKAARLLGAAFELVRDRIEKASEGNTRIANLGTFRVRNIERRKDEKPAKQRRVVTFVPSQPEKAS
jgi:nucleoid DNA-binding protein